MYATTNNPWFRVSIDTSICYTRAGAQTSFQIMNASCSSNKQVDLRMFSF